MLHKIQKKDVKQAGKVPASEQAERQGGTWTLN